MLHQYGILSKFTKSVLYKLSVYMCYISKCIYIYITLHLVCDICAYIVISI